MSFLFSQFEMLFLLKTKFLYSIIIYSEHRNRKYSEKKKCEETKNKFLKKILENMLRWKQCLTQCNLQCDSQDRSSLWTVCYPIRKISVECALETFSNLVLLQHPRTCPMELWVEQGADQRECCQTGRKFQVTQAVR